MRQKQTPHTYTQGTNTLTQYITNEIRHMMEIERETIVNS